jgi:hypothetical protein
MYLQEQGLLAKYYRAFRAKRNNHKATRSSKPALGKPADCVSAEVVNVPFGASLKGCSTPHCYSLPAAVRASPERRKTRQLSSS